MTARAPFSYGSCAMSRALWLSIFISLAACGEEERERPDGGGGTSTCGASGSLLGGQCMGLADCGRDDGSNFVRVVFCEHCFARADTHFCEAGMCREVPASTNVEY